MNHYKSWSSLKKQLLDCLFDPLKGRISYFLTRYHEVHNAYGRAAILLDKKEIASFSWIEEVYRENGENSQGNGFSDIDFLFASTHYLQLSIQDALASENDLIKVFAIMDKRVGKRRLASILNDGNYQKYPEWVQQFYRLRLEVSLD